MLDTAASAKGKEVGTDHAGAHHVLHNDDDCPDAERALLTEAVEEDLGHRLRASSNAGDVSAHAERERDVDRW